MTKQNKEPDVSALVRLVKKRDLRGICSKICSSFGYEYVTDGDVHNCVRDDKVIKVRECDDYIVFITNFRAPFKISIEGCEIENIVELACRIDLSEPYIPKKIIGINEIKHTYMVDEYRTANGTEISINKTCDEVMVIHDEKKLTFRATKVGVRLAMELVRTYG